MADALAASTSTLPYRIRSRLWSFLWRQCGMVQWIFMSSNFIYVTEPKELDPSAIAEDLAGSDWQAVSGDVAFTDSTQQPFAALLIRSNTHVDASILEYFPHLKHIVRAGVGLDNIDLDFCASHGITVHNAPGANADAVSDYAIAMMLFALRKLYKLTEEDVVQWNRFAFTGRNLSQQTIGIVGFGNIGKQLYRKLQGFTCREILIFDPFIAKDISLEANARVVDFEELLRLSSVISLHLPLTEHTKYLIGRRNLALLQENAVVINAAR